MGEPREDRALAAEALFAAAADQRRVEQLDRGLPFEAAVAAPASQTLPMPPWPIGETSV